MSRLDKLVQSWPSLALLLLIVFLPVYGPWASQIEGQWFPVTTKVTTFDVRPLPDGTTAFRFRYTKIRFCQFEDVRLDSNGMTVDFHRVTPPEAGSIAAPTLPVGPQVSNVWIAATPSLDNVEMWFFHRCHPFWLTITKVIG